MDTHSAARKTTKLHRRGDWQIHCKPEPSIQINTDSKD